MGWELSTPSALSLGTGSVLPLPLLPLLQDRGAAECEAGDIPGCSVLGAPKLASPPGTAQRWCLPGGGRGRLCHPMLPSWLGRGESPGQPSWGERLGPPVKLQGVGRTAQWAMLGCCQAATAALFSSFPSHTHRRISNLLPNRWS